MKEESLLSSSDNSHTLTLERSSLFSSSSMMDQNDDKRNNDDDSSSNTIVLFFFSKYSKTCMQLIHETSSWMSYRKICVDHPDIRHIILGEKEKYKVREVPCFLVFHATGEIDKWEGQVALEWIGKKRNEWLNRRKRLQKQEEDRLMERIESKTKRLLNQSSSSSSFPSSSYQKTALFLSDDAVSMIPAATTRMAAVEQQSSQGRRDCETASEIRIQPPFLEKDGDMEKRRKEDNIAATITTAPPVLSEPSASLGVMTRTMDTSPLIPLQYDPVASSCGHLSDELRSTVSSEVERKVLERKTEASILSVAQQLQSQREKEDEETFLRSSYHHNHHHANVVSSSPPS